MISRQALHGNKFGTFARCFSEVVGQNQGPSTPSAPPAAPASTSVPGLSSNVVLPATDPVGPGVDPNKSGAYKVPEYFCYDNMSFFEAEIEMSKFRLPQPSAVKK